MRPAEVSARRTLAAGDGLRIDQPEHAGRSQSSWEEADVVAGAIRALLGASFSDDGAVRELGPSDFLVVAPYNAQVRRLRQRVPTGVRVGTVDKFQGQEAPVVLISMASSTAEDAPRGIGFAFERNPGAAGARHLDESRERVLTVAQYALQRGMRNAWGQRYP